METELYLSLLTGIIGMSYPILLQLISTLDEKYESERIVSVFRNERIYKYFEATLILSIGSAIIWSLQLPPLVDFQIYKTLGYTSAEILFLTSTIVLVITFALFLERVIDYIIPNKLIQYLSEQHRTRNRIDHVPVLRDILIVSIKKENTNHCLKLEKFFQDLFAEYRLRNDKVNLEYPDDYHETIYKVVELMARDETKRHIDLEYGTAGAKWFLSGIGNRQISDHTYRNIWRVLLLSVRFKRDDFVLLHWATFHQKLMFGPRIHGHLNLSVDDEKNEITAFTDFKERVFEFHYALGGLLLFNERFNCIRQIFNYTQSQPADHTLLPNSIHEIIKFYSELRDPFNRKMELFGAKYPFVHTGGLEREHIVTNKVLSYMALLLLRQYVLVAKHINVNACALPQTPTKKTEIKKWIESIQYLQNDVQLHLDNKTLLSAVNLTFITDDWCNERSISPPAKLLQEIKKSLEGDYRIRASTDPLDPDKIEQFNINSEKLLSKTINRLMDLNNENTFIDDYSSLTIGVFRTLYSRDAFVMDQEADHLNFDTFFASTISERIINTFASSILERSVREYLVNPNDIFQAIRNLRLCKDHIIICFGNPMKSMDFQAIVSKVYYLPNNYFVRNSIFVLHKSDLPITGLKEISQDILKKYPSLTPMNKNSMILSTVIGLPELRQELIDEIKSAMSFDDDVNRSVLMSIALNLKISWKNNIKIIHVKEHHIYRNEGIPTKVNSIRRFNEL